MNKSFNAYKTIGEVAKLLGLKSKNSKTLPTHTIRYWEKEFKQIKPIILNGNRRYYDTKNIELLKKVYSLLKVKGMTINGVKKLLNTGHSNDLDEILNKSIRTDNLRNKVSYISQIIKNLKKLK